MDMKRVPVPGEHKIVQDASVESIDLYWVPDSYGVHTCHRNIPNATFNESLIGTLIIRDGIWHPVLKDKTVLGEYKSPMRARAALEAHYHSKGTSHG